ncbi:hypothetical protein H5A35_08750 [Pectobacterium brasiliense]|uniref:hypothetical protein n=1 Tax=Pectobacterium brasiliense TaxID=180957 RepID=UPI001969171D|nr:hypothetical protein [Pectobacterium brasiliense]
MQQCLERRHVYYQVSNGRWLLDIDGDVDVYDVARIPGNRIQVSGNATKFECSIDDVKGVGLITIERT